MLQTFLAAVVLVSASFAAPSAAGQRGDDDVATVTVIPGTTAARPGQWFPVAVIIDLKPKWHIHTNDPQVPPALGSPEDYIKTAISAGATADGRLRPDPSRIQWPSPVMAKVTFGGPPVEYGVFEGRVVAFLPVEVPPDAENGVATLQLTLTYQACDDRICLAPVEGSPHSAQIAIDASAVGFPENQTYPEIFKAFDATRLPAARDATPLRAGSSQAIWIAIAAGAAGLVVGLFLVLKRVL